VLHSKGVGILKKTDQDIPAHKVSYVEILFVRCPKCKKDNPVSWGDLEKGARHECEKCSYIWKVA